jgi:hypothetical protein
VAPRSITSAIFSRKRRAARGDVQDQPIGDGPDVPAGRRVTAHDAQL